MCCIAGCELTRVRWHIFSVELGRQSFSPWVGSGWGEEPWLSCMKCHHGDVSSKVVFQCLLRRSVELDLQITHRFSKNNGSVLEKLRQINFYYQFPSYYESALYWFRHWYFFSLSPCISSLTSYTFRALLTFKMCWLMRSWNMWIAIVVNLWHISYGVVALRSSQCWASS